MNLHLNQIEPLRGVNRFFSHRPSILILLHGLLLLFLSVITSNAQQEAGVCPASMFMASFSPSKLMLEAKWHPYVDEEEEEE